MNPHVTVFFTFVILTKTEMSEQMFVKFLCKSVQCYLTCNMHLIA